MECADEKPELDACPVPGPSLRSASGRLDDPMTIAAVALLVASLVATIAWVVSGQRLVEYHTLGAAAPALYLAAAAVLLRPRTRALCNTAVAVLIVAAVVPAFTSPAQEVGDWPEYYLMEASFMNHLTPDQRAADEASYQFEASQEGMSDELGIGFPGLDHRSYKYHFWLSSLTVAPLGYLLRLAGLPWLRAFAVMNALFVALAFCSIVLWSGLRDCAARAFGAFWILSPVAWYIAWPSADVWSASLVVLSIALATKRRFAWAVLAAAVASTQNPPLLVYVGLLVVLGLVTYIPTQRYGKVLLTLTAALPMLMPVVFSLAVFGTANPIVGQGEAGFALISLSRVLGFYFDLNQGIAPYAPVLVLLWLAAIALAVVRGSWFGVGLAATCVCMTVLNAMTADWGSGCIGPSRYALWQIPLLAWLIVGVLRPSIRIERWGLIALVAGQTAVALTVLLWPGYVPDYLHHGPLATAVLEAKPSLYRPEPDIFFDRTMHYEVSDSNANREAIPQGNLYYEDRFGRTRKVMINPSALSDAARDLGLSEDVIRSRMYPAGRGLFYLDFDDGSGI